MDHFAKINSICDAWVPQGHTPCSACVESPRFVSPDFTVEIGITAAK